MPLPLAVTAVPAVRRGQQARDAQVRARRVDGEGAAEVAREPDVQHLTSPTARGAGGQEPSGRGFNPRRLPCAQTRCVCQRVIGPPGVGPWRPRGMANMTPIRTSGLPPTFAYTSVSGRRGVR